VATARVERFLSFAELTEHDTLLDLGCGDGRVLRCAARQVGCRCVGVDVDSSLLETARREASREQVGELCSWLLADFRSAEVERALAQASCAVVFLVPGALHVVAQVLQTHYRTRLRDEWGVPGRRARRRGRCAWSRWCTTSARHLNCRLCARTRCGGCSCIKARVRRAKAASCRLRHEGVALCGIRCHRWHGV